MNRSIFVFLGLICTYLTFPSCSCSSSDKAEAKQEHNDDIPRKTYTPPASFDFDKWVDGLCASLDDNSIETVLKKSLDIYHMRLTSFISNQKLTSPDFLTKEDQYQEFVNSIIMGKLSAKSLEQIINTQIDDLVANSPDLRIPHIFLSHFDSSYILPEESVKSIISMFEATENIDISKKEKKELLGNYIVSEVLRNICNNLDIQDIENQFK